MASINKLSIRGVRSFSPDDDEQVISFYFPVTIIVGANGCGKTTIIESLKYAVTGTLPPGNKSGHAFVHDPKSVGQSVVKANIKLRFNNRAGQSMVVVRSMEVTQKKATMQFKALDGILRTTDPDSGERVSMSHKCTELDRQIPTFMGVSKPILEHVVFCHQEDSSWPLMEGAVLKKRFDDIFDSTRYAKALEAIRKARLEHQAIAKDHKADLAGLASHKHAANGFRSEFESTKELFAKLELDIATYDDEIGKERAAMAELSKVLNKMEEQRSAIEEKRGEIDKEQTVIAKQKSMLDEDWTDTKTQEDLRGMLRDFDEAVAGDIQRKEEMDSDEKRLRSQMNQLRQKRVKLEGRRGGLEAEKRAHERDLTTRIARMEDLASKYGVQLQLSQSQQNDDTTAQPMETQQTAGSESAGSITTTGGMTQETSVTVSSEDKEVFQRALQERQKTLKDELQSFRVAAQAEEDELNGVISDLTAKMKTIDTDRQRNNKKQQDARREIQSLSSQITGPSRIRKSDIDEAKRQADKFAKDRDQATTDPRRTEIPREIRSLEDKIDKVKRDIEDDNDVLRELRNYADEQNAVELLKHQITQDIESLDESVRDNDFILGKHNVKPTVSLSAQDLDRVDDYFQAMESMVGSVREKHDASAFDLSRASEELTSAQQQVSEKKALLSHNKRSLDKLKAQAQALNADDRGPARIKRVVASLRQFETTQRIAGSTVDPAIEPQELLEHMTKRIGEFALDEDKPESISRTVQKLKKMSIVKDDSGTVVDIICPCCSRPMAGEEVRVFNDKMDDLADQANSEIIQLDQTNARQGRSAMANYERWRNIVSQSINDHLDYKRVKGELEKLEETVPKETQELDTLEITLAKATEKVDGLREDGTELRQLLDLANRLRDDASRIADKNSQIQSRVSQLSLSAPSADGRDLRKVEIDLAAKTEEKDSFMNTIARLNKEMTALNSRLSLLTTQSSKAEQMVKEKSEKFEREQEAAARKTVLNDVVNECAQEEKRLMEQINPLKQKIRGKNSEKDRMRSTSKVEEDKLTDNLSKFNSDVRSLSGLNKKIDGFIGSNKLRDLDGIGHELAELTAATNKKQQDLEAMEPELEALKKKLDDQERHKRLITDNIDLMKSLKYLDGLNQRLSDLEVELASIEGSDKSNEDYNAAAKRVKEHNHAKARCEGRKGGLKEQMRHLRKKLQTPEYKNIDERHREKMIQHETTVMACSDLDKYYQALDKALLRYHGMKIEDINKIIRELWMLTYKGEDIANIELVSGNEGASKATRSYNYRVVMTKGNTQLDMRGRCSAGQRVLASIVIRLALAETFCLNCGVMALDEPTTNLDYANKRGLAIALAQIIASRAAQNNFQLVIITHDEDFVSMMKNELSTHTGFDMPERYFQVSREEGQDRKHYSKIHSIDWDEL